jgi:uncharacterized membrane protein YfcA
MLAEPSLIVIVWCALVLTLAGAVKGILGIGLPLISIPLLALVMPVPQAVALMPLPILFSNIWQSFHGGYFSRTIRRFWTVLLGLIVGTVIGTKVLTTVHPQMLYVLVGVVVVVFSLTSYLQPQMHVAPWHERWLAPAAGLLGGVLGGLSTIFGPPLIIFLVALHLQKDEFVGTIATFYLIGVVPLILALGAFHMMGERELLASSLATIPLLTGLGIGQILRRRIAQESFRRVLLAMLALLGGGLIVRAMLA